jgi:sugar phosphate isomerase/epimerase
MTNRRDFLKQTGLISAGMLLAKPDILLAKPSRLRVGLQLYSMRDYIGKDVKGVIARVAKAGYTEVETYGYDPAKNTYWGLSPKDFKNLLSDNGLRSPSGHYGMDQFLGEGKDAELKASIEAANIIGQDTIVIPYLADKYRKTTNDFKKLTQSINQIVMICKNGGLRTGYHNHDFEFQPVNGLMLYDVLLKEAHPLLTFEMDIFWVVRAGHDPVKLIQDNPGRFTMWHIKDMDKKNNGLNTEVGSGTIDFKAIFELQKQSGVRHIYMEQENFAIDADQSIAQSAAYIKNTLLK